MRARHIVPFGGGCRDRDCQLKIGRVEVLRAECDHSREEEGEIREFVIWYIRFD
jgi:hypothetical protein